ncbi:MAG: TIM barrel protein [Acidobacteria bacterium]|nr:TIM barrel protein [Acidobacteriota bacterium]
MNRREAVSLLAATPAAAQSLVEQKSNRKGRLKQGVTRGCFRGTKFTLDDMARHAARLGATGFDLIGEADWPTLKKHGLVPTMAPGAGSIKDGLNRKENHAALETTMRANLDKAAANGVPNVITFSGNRAGMGDPEAIENCVLFLNKVKAHAEDKGVTICMEYLNSKVNHPDYQFDNIAFAAEMCKRVNSPRVKILYDIYHAQIMEGDIIRTIRQHIGIMAHFHTAGNPGRHEFDETQELSYRGIAQAIVDLGFTGWLSHEYSPLKDALTSLDTAMTICDV